MLIISHRSIAWTLRFARSNQSSNHKAPFRTLSVQELNQATESKQEEIVSLKKTSRLLSTKKRTSEKCKNHNRHNRHPIILPSNHPLVKLTRLLHGGHLLISGSLSRRYYIVGGHKTIRSITRSCVICRRRSAKPRPHTYTA